MRPTRRAVPAVVLVSYGLLGLVLGWSRLTGLDRSYWHDEIVTVANFVRQGPDEILFGTYVSNNHELYSLLSWAASSVAGQSEIVVRLWSVIPFIAGVMLVAGWLHTRMGAPTAVLYSFFATLSPQLLDLSRQARGYGLAFLAMSALIVAASEADRTARTRAIAACCAAGVVGTWTLPIFGVAFLAAGGVLLTNHSIRRRTFLGLAGAAFAIAAWYAPHLDAVLSASEQEYGDPISWAAILISPVERVLLPAFLGADGAELTSTVGRLALTAVGFVLIASSPLLRRRRTALILGSGVVATLAVVWATRLYLLPRFVSFLLVPLLVFFASGTARALTLRPRSLRFPLALATLALVTVVFVSTALEITRFPREAHKDAAEVIQDEAAPTTPVFANMPQPADLAFYLDRPVRVPTTASQICESEQAVVLVVQPWRIEPVDAPCLDRAATRHYQFRQYSRGDEIDVWLVPAVG